MCGRSASIGEVISAASAVLIIAGGCAKNTSIDYNPLHRLTKEAEEEGNSEAARLFSQIARIEKHHEERYRKLLEMVENGTVYQREQPIRWKCSVCGHVHEGTAPPAKCPACKHPKEYYEPESMAF